MPRMDDRRKDDIAALRQDIKDNSGNIESLSGALMQFAVNADEQTQALRKEVYAHRRLSKYIRRTHFWTMAAMVFGALFLADIAHQAHSQWWGLLFWATQHGKGGTLEWVLRALGFFWQVGYLTYLIRIAQVPPDLWIAALQVKSEREQRKQNRRRRNA